MEDEILDSYFNSIKVRLEPVSNRISANASNFNSIKVRLERLLVSETV